MCITKPPPPPPPPHSFEKPIACEILCFIKAGCHSQNVLATCSSQFMFIGRSGGDILHFNHPRVSAVNLMATRTFREREKKKTTTAKPNYWVHSFAIYVYCCRICTLELFTVFKLKSNKTSSREMRRLYASVANECTLSFD